MSHVYACRHPKISLAFDTTWLAAIFASQAFDTEQAYWLYESLLDRLAGEFKPIAIRVTSVVLPQLLAQQDPQLHADLLKKGFDSACESSAMTDALAWFKPNHCFIKRMAPCWSLGTRQSLRQPCRFPPCCA